MKKLRLDLETLSIQTFTTTETGAAFGTVEAASDGTFPSDICPATMLLSDCPGCIPSGVKPCRNTAQYCE